MARIHVLEGNRLVLHHPVAVDLENEARPVAFALRALLVAAGMNASRLAVGTGAAQITQAEADLIAAGEVHESELSWPFGEQSDASRDQLIALWQKRGQEVRDELLKRFRFYGSVLD